MADVSKDYRHIVRVANTDLEGSKPLISALRKVKGVSFIFANAVCSVSGIDRLKKAGSLSQSDVEKLESVLKDPASNGIPEWMLNRRKDMETGSDIHLLGGDLRFAQDNDVKTLRKTKSLRGLRHASKLPLRGQRTKANFRRKRGKASLGVQKRKGAKKGK